jgi:hypothetical protein
LEGFREGVSFAGRTGVFFVAMVLFVLGAGARLSNGAALARGRTKKCVGAQTWNSRQK